MRLRWRKPPREWAREGWEGVSANAARLPGGKVPMKASRSRGDRVRDEPDATAPRDASHTDPDSGDVVLVWDDDGPFRRAIDQLRERGLTIVQVDAARRRVTIRIPPGGLDLLGSLVTDLDVAGAHLV